MFGIQWDLMLKFIETKNGKTQEELRKDSSSWGNYKNSTFTITKGKYSTNFGQTFKDVAKEENKRYTRPADENARVLLTPGIDKRFCVLNIYDIAGNIAEWTLEHALEDEKQPCAIRGGDAGSGVFAVAFRSLGNEETGTSGTGFRSTLY